MSAARPSGAKGNIVVVAALQLALLSSATAAINEDERYNHGSLERSIFGRENTQTAAATCGGSSSLSQCDDGFPSDFCCAVSSSCMRLNTTATNAVICCPPGSTCESIQPITCDKNAQNATVTPAGAIHADPVLELESCGGDGNCCPMGYQCQNGGCNAITTAVGNSPGGSTSTTLTSSPSINGGSGPTAATTSTLGSDASVSPTSGATPAAVTNSTSAPTAAADAEEDFSAKSFIAGFVPGIFIGMILIFAGMWCMIRRRHRRTMRGYGTNEKTPNLTSLAPWSSSDLSAKERVNNGHGRTISDPIARQSSSHRIDFLRSSPAGELGFDPDSYQVEIVSPNSKDAIARPSRPLRRISNILRTPSATPKPTQSPLPSHMRRGHFSFQSGVPNSLPRIAARISPLRGVAPIRGLNHKNSTRSLRRQATDASDSSRRALRGETGDVLDRKGSAASNANTIVVAFPGHELYSTPDVRRQKCRQGEAQTRSPLTISVGGHNDDDDTVEAELGGRTRTVAACSSIYSPQPDEAEMAYTTPTRPPAIPAHHLQVPTWGGGNDDHDDGQDRLGSPYTPTNRGQSSQATRPPAAAAGRPALPGLGVERYAGRRETSFSALMHNAGLSDSELAAERGRGTTREI